MKRKPRGLKLLQGTDRKDRDLPEPNLPVPDKIERPDWLVDPEAVAEWDRMVDILHPARVLTVGDLAPLGHMCNMHAAVVKRWRHGPPPLSADLAQLRYMYQEFGLTPASRSKANMVPDDGESINPFHSLNAKKGA